GSPLLGPGTGCRLWVLLGPPPRGVEQAVERVTHRPRLLGVGGEPAGAQQAVAERAAHPGARAVVLELDRPALVDPEARLVVAVVVQRRAGLDRLADLVDEVLDVLELAAVEHGDLVDRDVARDLAGGLLPALAAVLVGLLGLLRELIGRHRDALRDQR